MARKVFFSFHYARDIFRIMQVRNSWVVRPGNTAPPFYDKAEFEQAKQRAGGIEKWIDKQLTGCSVTVILYGAETAARRWVNYEIQRSVDLGKGILAIDIHRIKDLRYGADVQGDNPLSLLYIQERNRRAYLSDIYQSYDWVLENGYKNMPAWIETAARAVGR